MEHRLAWTFAERPTNGGYVLYWMQASVRVRDNLGLAWAQLEARRRNLNLEVLYCLDPDPSEGNGRRRAFELEGLKDVAQSLLALGIAFSVARTPAVPTVVAAGSRAALVVFDRGYLPRAREQRAQIAAGLPCPVVVAEDNVSVPIRLVSEKDEWAAATLRPKLMRLAALELALPQPQPSTKPSDSRLLNEALDEALDEAGYPLEKVWFGLSEGAGLAGETRAWDQWQRFRDDKLANYSQDRNDPNLEATSRLSAALRFGHISPISLIADLKARGLWREALSYRRAGEDPISKFLDELLVRRELSINFVVFNPDHATWLGLPEWARRSLTIHREDKRTALYRRADWERGQTHDPIWNAAQYQLVSTGIMHGYLRMYWGKKLLEWSEDPAEAYLDALYLNNKYALDGDDPNSYAGVAWCFGKHDRPWGERNVYGLVRCMTAGGLRKKIDVDQYVKRFTPPN